MGGFGQQAALASPALAPTVYDGVDYSCRDWWARLQAGKSLIPDDVRSHLNEARAAKAVAMFNKLRLPDVAGQPYMRDAAGEWQRDIVRCAMGGFDPALAVQWLQQIGVVVPKKNSKTTGGAGVGVTALLSNERPLAELILIGPTQEVADLAFSQAAGMVAADPEGYLQGRLHVRDHKKEIKDRLTGAKLKVKTFDLKVSTGSKPVFILADELHIMSQYSYATRVIGQLTGGMIANPEALIIYITTLSDTPPEGVFLQELTSWRNIRDGKSSTKGVLPIIYEFPAEIQRDESKPWKNPAIWHYVLPNLNYSITLKRLHDDFVKAEEKGDAELLRWASQHLNIQPGLASFEGIWAGALYWEQQSRPIDLDMMIRDCEVLTIGIDGGGLDDLLGVAVMGRRKSDGKWLLWGKAWAQEIVFERRKEIAEKLRDFVKAGSLVICPVEDATRDLREIADLCVRLKIAGKLPAELSIGVDRYAITALVTEIMSRKDAAGNPHFDEKALTAIPQGGALAPASWGMERKLSDGSLIVSDDPLLSWSAGNCKVIVRGNAQIVEKAVSGRAKIDPTVAAFNAFMLMAKNPQISGLLTSEEIIKRGGLA